MKILLIIPLVLAVVTGAGILLCQAAGWTLDTHAMLTALSAVFFGSMIAMMPAALMRNSPVSTISQAAFAGTVLQLFLVMMFALVGWVAKFSGDTNAFLCWLLAFYWTSLIALVLWSVRLVRTAPPDPRTETPASRNSSAPVLL